MTDKPLKPQATLKDYVIKRVLGRGAFGITYLAENVNEGYTVAIKEYFPSEFAERDGDGTTVNPSESSSTPEHDFQTSLNKFLEESRVLGSFESPYIVRVVDTFELNGTAYMVMQYEEGGTLARYLNAHDAPLDEGKILAIFIPVLEGLKDIHAKWLLHRDIKPDNIYIRKDGSPLLIDFGTARHALSAKRGGMTEYLTPGFAPPEQYDRHEDHGPWTDIYAAGATMYCCVTRIVPPEGRRRVSGKDPVMPATKAAPAFYNRRLLEVIDWMMTPDATQRPQSVDEVLGRLRELKDDRTDSVEERQEMAAAIQQAEQEADQGNKAAPVTKAREPREPGGMPVLKSTGVPRGNKNEELKSAATTKRIETGGGSRRIGWLIAGVSALVLIGAAVMLLQPFRVEPADPAHEAQTGTKQPVMKTTKQTSPAPLQPQTEDSEPKQNSAEIDRLLKQCFGHIQAGRLTSGVGDNAPDCYRRVLKLEPGNVEALEGLERVELERRSEGKRTN